MNVQVDTIQIGFMPGRRRADALFVVREMLEKYSDKMKKLDVCFMDIEKVFDKDPQKVIERVIRKKGLTKIIARAVMKQE